MTITRFRSMPRAVTALMDGSNTAMEQVARPPAIGPNSIRLLGEALDASRRWPCVRDRSRPRRTLVREARTRAAVAWRPGTLPAKWRRVHRRRRKHRGVLHCGREKVGDKGRVVAFEPSPRTSVLLAHNVERHGVAHIVDVRTEAVGCTRDIRTFRTYENGLVSGFGEAPAHPPRESFSRKLQCQ